LDGIEAIKKILAEAPGEHLGAKVAVLDNPKQLGLHGKRGFLDFIKENGAAVGVLEQTRAVVRGFGERAAHMTEELALEKQKAEDRGGHSHCRRLLKAERLLQSVDGVNVFDLEAVNAVSREFLSRGAYELSNEWEQLLLARVRHGFCDRHVEGAVLGEDAEG